MASTKEISNMTFRCVPGRDLSSFKDNLQMFNIIAAMDGRRSVSTVAREDFYEVDFLAEKVNELVQQGFLESVHVGASASAIKLETITYLQDELAKHVGPVAGILLKNTAAKMGDDINNFPVERVGELLDHISSSIPNKGKAAKFKRSILSRLD
jgi:hypothetical protein